MRADLLVAKAASRDSAPRSRSAGASPQSDETTLPRSQVCARGPDFAALLRRIPSATCALALVVLLQAACGPSAGSVKLERPAAPIERLAILRVERGQPSADATAATRDANPNPMLPPDAETVVTAQMYGVLANDTRWRLVPDLDVEDAMRSVRLGGTLESRAQALGKETKADAVITGRVTRLQDRFGGDYGTRYPASVAFELEVVETSTGKVLWTSAFDQTQRDLSSNLLDFWMFWRGGPRWFTSAELARLGVEKLVEQMDEAFADEESAGPS